VGWVGRPGDATRRGFDCFGRQGFAASRVLVINGASFATWFKHLPTTRKGILQQRAVHHHRLGIYTRAHTHTHSEHTRTHVPASSKEESNQAAGKQESSRLNRRHHVARRGPRDGESLLFKHDLENQRKAWQEQRLLTKDKPFAQLIHHTINNFNIQPDKLAVARVTESLSTLQQARDLRVRDAEASLRKLARQLATLESQHEHEAAAHSSPADHASRIATLDTQKFRTAKAASDAEMEAERLASRAADLAARLQELDLQGVEGDLGSGGDGGRRGKDPVDDEVLLRLKVYRSLGIDIERDSRDGEWSRAVVRNDRKGDVHVVNMDKKFSRFFYANYFWQTL